MIASRRWMLVLFGAGLVMLLFSSWILEVTLPPRHTMPRTGRSIWRKLVRIVPRDQGKRSECGAEPAQGTPSALARSGKVHDLTDRDPGCRGA
jgi:hypothetical protein